MDFEEWYKRFDLAGNDDWSKDLREAFEAGWNACAKNRLDMTYEEYLEFCKVEE